MLSIVTNLRGIWPSFSFLSKFDTRGTKCRYPANRDNELPSESLNLVFLKPESRGGHVHRENCENQKRGLREVYCVYQGKKKKTSTRKVWSLLTKIFCCQPVALHVWQLATSKHSRDSLSDRMCAALQFDSFLFIPRVDTRITARCIFSNKWEHFKKMMGFKKNPMI